MDHAVVVYFHTQSWILRKHGNCLERLDDTWKILSSKHKLAMLELKKIASVLVIFDVFYLAKIKKCN